LVHLGVGRRGEKKNLLKMGVGLFHTACDSTITADG